MDRKEFEQAVIKALQKKLGGGYQVEDGKQDRNGGKEGHSIYIRRSGINASLAVRLEEHCRDKTAMECYVDEVAGQIAKVCREHVPEEDIDLSCFTDWEAIKPHVFGSLVNTERNREGLADIPHREFLDLSLAYHARMEGAVQGKHAIVPIRKEYMERWGVEEEDLYHAAMKNMQDTEDTAFESLGELLGPYLGRDTEDETELGCPMFVLGNRGWQNGAVQMCNQEKLAGIAEFLKDDFWILPSSIHEVIVVPVGRSGEEAEELIGVVKDVNDTVLAPEEILSNHVYRYRRLTGEITIEA